MRRVLHRRTEPRRCRSAAFAGPMPPSHLPAPMPPFCLRRIQLHRSVCLQQRPKAILARRGRTSLYLGESALAAHPPQNQPPHDCSSRRARASRGIRHQRRSPSWPECRRGVGLPAGYPAGVVEWGGPGRGGRAALAGPERRRQCGGGGGPRAGSDGRSPPARYPDPGMAGRRRRRPCRGIRPRPHPDPGPGGVRSRTDRLGGADRGTRSGRLALRGTCRERSGVPPDTRRAGAVDRRPG